MSDEGGLGFGRPLPTPNPKVFRREKQVFSGPVKPAADDGAVVLQFACDVRFGGVHRRRWDTSRKENGGIQTSEAGFIGGAVLCTGHALLSNGSAPTAGSIVSFGVALFKTLSCNPIR